MPAVNNGFNKFTAGKHGAGSGNDEYYTPKIYWDSIKKHIPKTKIWEAFYGDGTSAGHLKDLGFNVMPDQGDFFTAKPNKACIVSNPPYSLLYKIFEKLVDMPNKFILIIPIPKLSHLKTQKFLKEMKVQVIIPNQYTGFILNGKQTRCPPVYLCYLCRGLNLPRDLLYL